MNAEIKERIAMINRGKVPEGYKKTKVGIIPEDWEVYKLRDIISDLESGISVNSEDVKANGDEFGVLKTSAVYNGKFLPSENKRIIENEISRAKINPKKDAIIISRMNTPELVGETGYVDKDYDNLFLPDRLWQTKFNDDIYVNGKWLSSLLTTEKIKFKIKNIATGTSGSMKNISKNNFLSITISYPNKPEQQKIAQILSTWDKAIELKEKLIEEKKKQKKGLMQRLLTGVIRLPGFDGGWEEVKLGKVVKKIKGKAIKYLENGIYPVIDMDYLENGVYRNYSNDNSVFADEKDLLFLWDGSRAGKAFTGVYGIVGSTFVKLECKNINNIFLKKNLELNEKKIRKLCEGSGIPHIPKDFLSFYKIRMPTKEEQKAIAQVLSTADKEIELLEKELEQLKLQKKGLMQLLLTGIVRVKP